MVTAAKGALASSGTIQLRYRASGVTTKPRIPPANGLTAPTTPVTSPPINASDTAHSVNRLAKGAIRENV